MPAREEQRPRRVFPEARGEERGLAHAPHDLVLDLVRVRQEERHVRGLVGLRQAEDEAVIRPDHFDVGAALLFEARQHGCSPGRMHAGAERRHHADAPVSDLIHVALDDDDAVARDFAGGLDLFPEVREQVVGRFLVEAVPLAQTPRGGTVRLRRELGLTELFRFVPFTQDTANLYQASDVVVAPSQGPELGRPVLEAFASGRPVVASGSISYSVVPSSATSTPVLVMES